jgi:hypothetical protein
VFEGLEGKALADYIVTTAQGLPGHREFCRHQHHIGNRAREWARCIEKFYYPYGSDPIRVGTFGEMVDRGTKETKENKINNERQQSAIDRIKTGVDYVKEKLLEIPEKVGEMKELLINAIKDLFGVRPSDQTLNRYPELWHPDFLREVEIVIIEEQSQEEVSDLKSEEPPSNEKQAETVSDEEYSLCHTSSGENQQNGHQAESLEGLLEKESRDSATPPLYMKVIIWASGRTNLTYQGNPVFSTVQLQGEKLPRIQSIKQNQQVIITDHTHSSFLFHQDDEENIQLYVKPIDSSFWLTGISVLAKNLQPILDG